MARPAGFCQVVGGLAGHRKGRRLLLEMMEGHQSWSRGAASVTVRHGTTAHAVSALSVEVSTKAGDVWAAKLSSLMETVHIVNPCLFMCPE